MRQKDLPGFWQSEIGCMPDDWAQATLGAVCNGELQTGPFGSQLHADEYEAEGVSVLMPKDLVNCRANLYSAAKVSVIRAQKLAKHRLEQGDLLFSRRGDVTRFALIEKNSEGALCGTGCLRARPSKNYSSQYLCHLLKLKPVVQWLQQNAVGQTMPNMNTGILSSLPLVLPSSLFEQQKIASILTAVDDKLDVISRQIEATQTLKRGLVQTLFSRGAGTQDATGRWFPHTKFKDSELGTIPALWDVGAIADFVSALRSGVSVNAEDRVHGDDEVGVLKVSCVLRGGFYPNLHKTVVPEELDRVAEPVLEGRIIISRANTPALVGESAYVDCAWPNLYLPDKLWQTEPSDRPHSIKWLSFYLQSPFVRQEISKAATGTSGSMKNIAKAAFLSIRMPLVPLAEQEHIAAILSGVTSKIEALSSKQSHYQVLKRGLMQKLLTGEWRVRLDTPTGSA